MAAPVETDRLAREVLAAMRSHALGYEIREAIDMHISEPLRSAMYVQAGLAELVRDRG